MTEPEKHTSSLKSDKSGETETGSSGRSQSLKNKGKIGRAIVLPWGTAIKIARNSMKQRFWRSMITTALVVMAIAFMIYMSSQSAVLSEMKVRFDAHETEFKTKENPTVEEKESYKPWEELGERLDKLGLSGSNSSEREAQTYWLMFLAALVALVGISNAMLMSVTERFQEIGTMKCLGALDSFIIKLFFLESVFQGMVGTIVGMVVGLLLMCLYVTIQLGGIVWANFPVWQVTKWVFLSFAVGTFISTIAAILPAWRAAIMQPVDALRSEM